MINIRQGYFKVHPDTPSLGVRGDYRSSVHFGNLYRLNRAKEQASLPTVDIANIIDYVIEFLEAIGIEIKLSPIVKEPLSVTYKKIKEDNELEDERDIVWMKFTTDGYLGVVATSNDINFDIPKSEAEYDSKEKYYNDYERKYKYTWKHNSAGILIHQLGKQWDSSFVLVFPLKNIPKGYNRGDIERAIGNCLIDKGVPILDFYSHNF